ncbi:hypothetical protein ACT3G8_11140 [Azospirillum aestuarii]
MAESAGVLPGLSPVAGKPVHTVSDGSHVTSDVGILLLAEIDRTHPVSDADARRLGQVPVLWMWIRRKDQFDTGQRASSTLSEGEAV